MFGDSTMYELRETLPPVVHVPLILVDRFGVYSHGTLHQLTGFFLLSIHLLAILYDLIDIIFICQDFLTFLVNCVL